MNKRMLAVVLCVTSVGARAAEVVNHPTGKAGIFMADKRGLKLLFFNATTFEQESSVDVPVNPHDFALSADHKRAYVTLYGDGVYGKNPHPGHQVLVVDLVAQKIIDTIDVAPWRGPHGIQIDSKGMLYVTSDMDQKILVIDPKTKQIVSAINSGGNDHWATLLPNASHAYTSNKMDGTYISVVDLHTKTMTKIAQPDGMQGIATSPDGKTVVVANASKPRLEVVSTASNTVVSEIDLKDAKQAAFKPEYSPDGKWIAVVSQHDQVTLIHANDLQGPQTVIAVGKGPQSAAFSQDGKTMLVCNHDGGTVSVIDLTKMEVVKTFNAGTGVETLSYF